MSSAPSAVGLKFLFASVITLGEHGAAAALVGDAGQHTLLAGPASVEELYAWPTDLVQRVCSSGDRKAVLLKSLHGGGLHTTYYSGYDCPREMVLQVMTAMQHLGFDVSPQAQRFVRSCDNAKLPQEILCWASENLDDCHTCVFTNIEGCLDEETVADLDKMVPHLNNTTLSDIEKQETVAGYKQMLQ